MRIVFDLDDTLCVSQDKDYSTAQPMKERIEKVNNLHKLGHTIVISSARSMGRFNGDVQRCYDEYYELTKSQLAEWGLQYDELYLGKQSGDLYVGNEAVNHYEFFEDYKP